MGKYLSLVKSPVHAVRSTFQFIKQITKTDDKIYVDDKLDSSFDIDILKSMMKKFLDEERSYDKEEKPATEKEVSDYLNHLINSDNIEFYVIYSGENLAGFIGFQSKRVTDAVSGKLYPDTMHLRCLYIDDKYRRKGLATSALHKMENAAVTRKKKELQTFVHSKNEKGLAMYYKYGFESEGEATSKKKSDKKKSSESIAFTITMGKESAIAITCELYNENKPLIKEGNNMNLQLKDPSGNILVSLESTPVTPTVESMTTGLVEATKAVESAFDETEKYSNAMAVMSSEGFGEQAKAVASKVWEKIKEFFKWLLEWLKKFKNFISEKVFKVKLGRVKDSSKKQKMDQVAKNINNLSDKLEKDSQGVIATIDGKPVEVIEPEELEKAKVAQKRSKIIQEGISKTSHAFNRVVDEEIAAEANPEEKKTETFDETTGTIQNCIRAFDELSNAQTSEDIDKIMHNRLGGMFRNKDGSQFNGTFAEFMASKDTVLSL